MATKPIKIPVQIDATVDSVIEGLRGIYKESKKIGKGKELVGKYGLELTALSRPVEDVRKRIKQLLKEVNTLPESYEKSTLHQELLKEKDALEDLTKGVKDYGDMTEEEVENAMEEYLELEKALDDTKTGIDRAADGMQGFGSDAREAFGAIQSGKPIQAMTQVSGIFKGARKNIIGMSQGLQEWGGELAKQGGTLGKMGEGISSLGVDIGGLAGPGFAAAAAVAAIVAGVAAVVAILGMAEGKIKAFNKELLASANASDLMGAAFGTSAAEAASGSYDLGDALGRIRSQLSDVRYMDEYKEALAGITAAGGNLPQIANQLGGLQNALEGARVYSQLWGIDLKTMGEMMGDWSQNLRMSVETVRNSFSQVNRDAIASGMSVQKFVGIVSAASKNLGTFTSRVTEISAAVRGFAQGGMAAKDAEKAITDLTGALENMDQQQVRKLTASMIRNGAAQEVYNSAVDEGVAKVNAAAKGMSGLSGALATGSASVEDIKAAMSDTAAFEKLPDAVKQQMADLKDTLGKDMGRVLDAEEIMKKAKFTTKLDLMIKHIPGLEKGFAGLDKASDEQLNMISKTYGVNLQTLQNMRNSVRVQRMSGKSDEDIKKSLEEQQQTMEEQMAADKANADRIAGAKTASFAWLAKAGEAFMMIIDEVLAAVADLGIFDILRAAMELLTGAIGFLLTPIKVVAGILKQVIAPFTSLSEEGSVLSGILTVMQGVFENAGKVVKLVFSYLMYPVILLGKLLKRVVGYLAPLIKGFKEGSSMVGKIIDALQGLFDAAMDLLAPFDALFELLLGLMSFDEVMSMIGSALVNLVKKMGDVLVKLLWDLPSLLLKGLWAVVKGIAKILYNVMTLPIQPFIWVAKQLWNFFSNFTKNLTKPIDFVLGIFDKIQAWVKKIPVIGWILSALIDVLKLPYKLLKGAIQMLGKVGGWLWAGFTAPFKKAFALLQTLGKWVWNGITAPFKAAWAILTKLGKWLWDKITSPFRWLMKKITGFFKKIKAGWDKAVGWLASLPLIGGFFGGGGAPPAAGDDDSKKEDEAKQEAADDQADAAAKQKKAAEEQIDRISEMTGIDKDELRKRAGLEVATKKEVAQEEVAAKKEAAQEEVSQEVPQKAKAVDAVAEKEVATKEAAAETTTEKELSLKESLANAVEAMPISKMLKAFGIDTGGILSGLFGSAAAPAPEAAPEVPPAPEPPSILEKIFSPVGSLFGDLFGGKATPTPAATGAEVGATAAGATEDSSSKTVNMTFNIGNGDPDAIAAIVRKVIYEEGLADSS